MNMKNNPSYSEHLDTLIALVTYLALTNSKSRTPSSLSKNLNLDQDQVNFVLENFKSLFRKSKTKSTTASEHYYTLHARYAFRSHSNGEDDEDIAREPLSSDYLTKLIDFIVNKSEIEHDKEKQKLYSKTTMTSAIVAAFISVLVAFLTILSNHFIQQRNIANQFELKKYEITFDKKRGSYSQFMKEVVQLFTASTTKASPVGTIDLNVFSTVFSLEKAYYDIAPFLGNAERIELWNKVNEYEDFSLQIARDSIDSIKSEDLTQKFSMYRKEFSDLLESNLF